MVLVPGSLKSVVGSNVTRSHMFFLVLDGPQKAVNTNSSGKGYASCRVDFLSVGAGSPDGCLFGPKMPSKNLVFGIKPKKYVRPDFTLGFYQPLFLCSFLLMGDDMAASGTAERPKGWFFSWVPAHEDTFNFVALTSCHFLTKKNHAFGDQYCKPQGVSHILARQNQTMEKCEEMFPSL